MAAVELIMTIDVFDEDRLIEAARKHMPGTEIADASDALIALLDPAGGGDAYAGNLNEAGIQIEDSRVEYLPCEP